MELIMLVVEHIVREGRNEHHDQNKRPGYRPFLRCVAVGEFVG